MGSRSQTTESVMETALLWRINLARGGRSDAIDGTVVGTSLEYRQFSSNYRLYGSL